MAEERKALLIIDMLNDFIQEGAPLRVPGADRIIPNIKREVGKARSEGVPVIYICDRHRKDDPEFKVWPPHAIEGTRGAEVVDELKPQRGDYLVPKLTYSGFYGTDLERILRELGVNHLIITGVCTEICVLYTSADAYMRGYRVTVPEDCVAGLTEEDHRFALKQITQVLKPRVS